MDKYKLWYEEAADLFEEALPIGNGSQGMMVYGGIRDELLELNHDSLWSGYHRVHYNHGAKKHLDKVRAMIDQEDYAGANTFINNHMLGQYGESYMPLGNLRLQFRYNGLLKKADYLRGLSLDQATVWSQYTIDGNLYKRRAFASNPDQVMVYQVTSEDFFDLNISMDSKLLSQIKILASNTICLEGVCPEHVDPSYMTDILSPITYPHAGNTSSLEFISMTGIETDGFLVSTGMGLLVRNATYVVLYNSNQTTYNGYDKGFLPIDTIRKSLLETLEKAMDKGYESIFRAHLKDYQSLYNRVDFSLGEDPKVSTPTNKRVEACQQGHHDKYLIPILFQYGRYLLIASSRPSGEPANLQGIWSYEMRPPWSSNYTSNINVQMNYWLAETCNLSECHEPLLDLIKEMALSGVKAANNHFGCGGWTAPHNIDLWRRAAPTGGKAQHAFFPMSGPWLVSHLMEHYYFTGDQSFLRKVYPIIKGAVIFCKDWLIEDQSGYLLTSPSTSPENTFISPKGNVSPVSKGSTIDMTLMREVFNTLLEVTKVLDFDHVFAGEIKSLIPKLYPYKIGGKGQLQEWFKDFEEDQKGHRHVSHLYGVYPGCAINETTPDLFQAAKRSLELRLGNGGGHTGWSCAWIINLFARFKASQKANHYIEQLLSRSMYPNLFDAHPPFQIDGNFGATAGIAEMLVQSHMDYIELLPALPDTWQSGQLNGLRARGGYRLNFAWEMGHITYVRIVSNKELTCLVRYKGKSYTLETNVDHKNF